MAPLPTANFKMTISAATIFAECDRGRAPLVQPRAITRLQTTAPTMSRAPFAGARHPTLHHERNRFLDLAVSAQIV
jgi:hypothetical protein